MKRISGLICVLFALLLVLSACTSSSSVQISCNDFMKQTNISKQIEVSVGDAFTVKLCSDTSIGLVWSEGIAINNESVIRQIDHKHVYTGAKVEEIRIFRAIAKGYSTIKMECNRPWESGDKGRGIFTLNVTIR